MRHRVSYVAMHESAAVSARAEHSNRYWTMKDAGHLRAKAWRCLKLARRAKRSDVREALLSLAQDFEAEAHANETGADTTPSLVQCRKVQKP